MHLTNNICIRVYNKVYKHVVNHNVSSNTFFTFVYREVLQVIEQEVNKTDLNKAMHGEVFEGFCQILESLLPDK